mgnify:CR=1 FL=1
MLQHGLAELCAAREIDLGILNRLAGAVAKDLIDGSTMPTRASRPAKVNGLNVPRVSVREESPGTLASHVRNWANEVRLGARTVRASEDNAAVSDAEALALGVRVWRSRFMPHGIPPTHAVRECGIRLS